MTEAKTLLLSRIMSNKRKYNEPNVREKLKAIEDFKNGMSVIHADLKYGISFVFTSFYFHVLNFQVFQTKTVKVLLKHKILV